MVCGNVNHVHVLSLGWYTVEIKYIFIYIITDMLNIIKERSYKCLFGCSEKTANVITPSENAKWDNGLCICFNWG